MSFFGMFSSVAVFTAYRLQRNRFYADSVVVSIIGHKMKTATGYHKKSVSVNKMMAIISIFEWMIFSI